MYIGWDIGIKNLSYCILDIKGNIKEWDIIDLTGLDSCDFKCACLKKNKEPCGKGASYINKLNTGEFYCKTHVKNKEEKDIIELFKCFKCKRNAKKRHIETNTFYCLNHTDKDKEYDTIIVKNIAKEKLNVLGNILIKKLNSKPNILDVSHVVIENQPVLKNPTMKSIQMILYTYYLMNFQSNPTKLNINLVSANTKLKFNLDSDSIKKVKQIKNKYQKNKKLAIEYCKYFINDTEWMNYFNNYTKRDDLADSYLLIKYYLKKVVFKE